MSLERYSLVADVEFDGVEVDLRPERLGDWVNYEEATETHQAILDALADDIMNVVDEGREAIQDVIDSYLGDPL